MEKVYYLIAAILLVIWAIGFIGFALSGLIHLLLIFAGVAVLIGIVHGGRTTTKITLKK